MARTPGPANAEYGLHELVLEYREEAFTIRT